MFLLAVTLYFLLACLISWMVLFPSGREFVLAALAGAGARLQQKLDRAAERQRSGIDALRRSGNAAAGNLRDFLGQHYLLCLGGLALLCLPPLAAFLLAGKPTLNGYEASTREVNTQVAGLLAGEQLVPPPALPPRRKISANMAMSPLPTDQPEEPAVTAITPSPMLKPTSPTTASTTVLPMATTSLVPTACCASSALCL